MNARVSTAVVVAGLIAGGVCLYVWPPSITRVDPLETPFYGPHQVTTFVHGFVPHTTGQRVAHKLILGLCLAVVALASLPWWDRVSADRWRAVWGRVRGWVPRVNPFRTGLAALAVFAFVVWKEAPNLRKVPDLSKYTAGELATTEVHLTVTLGHADRLATGDVLFRQVTPMYGLLVTTGLAAYERACGLVAMGDLIRGLVAAEIVGWAVLLYLYAAWSRGRWLTWVVPIFLVAQHYWTTSAALVPPNHSPLRIGGMMLALVAMLALRRRSARVNQWAGGVVAGLAVLNNVESGVAATAGVLAYLHGRYTFAGREARGGSLMAALGRVAAGGAAVVAAFVVFYRVGCGAWPDPAGLKQYLLYSRISSSGFGSYPYTFHLWPLVIFAHTAWVVVHTALGRSRGFRPTFRVALGTMILVWFAYFANRPHIEYVCSYVGLYGLLLIDSARAVGLSVRRRGAVGGLQVATAAVAVGFAALTAANGVKWSWRPSEWEMVTTRWQVPMVPRDGAPDRPAVRVSKVYLDPGVAAAVQERADFLRRVASGGRAVYFTVDSFLIPRLSGVLPQQEFADPVEALTYPYYRRLLRSVEAAPADEIYVDARDCGKLIWYGLIYTQLRKDLSVAFEKDRVECGWEVWRRRPTDTAGRGN